jgi:hypothetical protein
MLEKQVETKIIKELLRVFPEVFPVESEETMAGFPDILAENADRQAYHFELKIVHDDGTVHFEKSQHIFYARHWRLNILCILYRDDNQVYIVPAQQVASPGTEFKKFSTLGLFCVPLAGLAKILQRYSYFGLSVFKEGGKHD